MDGLHGGWRVFLAAQGGQIRTTVTIGFTIVIVTVVTTRPTRQVVTAFVRDGGGCQALAGENRSSSSRITLAAANVEAPEGS
jgi:hypothetical protein